MGLGVIFKTVCGMDAAFEPPWMGLRRVEKGHTETHAGGYFKLKLTNNINQLNIKNQR